MKASELRIGNYIWENYGGVYLVRGLPDDKNITVSKSKTTIAVSFTLNTEIQPIPLTEEWLLKFGFEIRYFNEDKSKPLFWKVEGNRHIDIYPHKEHKFYFLINSLQMSTPIKYVHQLQNLYHALTGEELTLTNI